MHYRAKWYVERGAQPVLSGYGIHGQHLFVDRAREIVVAKFSSQALPLDGDAIPMTYRAVDAIQARLAGD
jgi:CubicO group peptidase (beta-lactamase class C family)